MDNGDGAQSENDILKAVQCLKVVRYHLTVGSIHGTGEQESKKALEKALKHLNMVVDVDKKPKKEVTVRCSRDCDEIAKDMVTIFKRNMSVKRS